ncbi:MAG: hypothetical protein GX081_11965 [Firmicutes bacterium]|nr:hypothetical protein [Bacillota bacterium]
MKKLNITWEGVMDTTGYLFSFAKALSAALKNSPYREYAEDIVATSGFAFRMWVAADLCPSATSIWAFNQQKPWVENAGLSCAYVERLWEQEELEEERRLAAIEMIRKSIDNGIAAICWDIGVPEWGLVTGYDDRSRKLATLSITGAEDKIDYAQLGKREIPILSVLTITGKTGKAQEAIISDSLELVKNHLQGGEWCENAQGLAAYPALIKHFEDDFNPDRSWNMEYYLGTYAALKWYAWQFFAKYGITKLAEIYKTVFESWQKAFELKKSTDLSVDRHRRAIAELLKTAEDCEKAAVELM